MAGRSLPFQAALACAVDSATTPQMNSALRCEDRNRTRTGNAWEWQITRSQADALTACCRCKLESEATALYKKPQPKWLPASRGRMWLSMHLRMATGHRAGRHSQKISFLMSCSVPRNPKGRAQPHLLGSECCHVRTTNDLLPAGAAHASFRWDWPLLTTAAAHSSGRSHHQN